MDEQEKPEILSDQLILGYYGPKVESGRMNSYEAAAYIIAFSDYIGIASRTIYGESVQLRTEIQGFRGQSFDIEFLLEIGGYAATLLSGAPFTINDLISLIKGSMKAWIHLGGNPPKSITHEENQIKIENQNGQITYINGDVYNIINDARAGKAVEDFIRKPLESDISGLHIFSKKTHETIRIEQKDAGAFVPLDMEKPLMEQEIKMGLIIESPTFKEGNKWKFFDGQNSFYADIEDEAFLERVNKGIERFGKGDRLIVRLRIRQVSTFDSLRMERTVIEVLDHEEGTSSSQNKLFF